MQNQSFKDQIIDWSAIVLALSVAFTGIFWCCYYNNQNAKDLFSVFGIIVTIIGLIIALVQIARLRNEKDIIYTTNILAKINTIKELLIECITRLSGAEKVNVLLINKHIDNLYKVQKGVDYLRVENCKHINCDFLNDNILSIIEDLNKEIENKALKTFRMTLYNSRINKILQSIIDTEHNINTGI